MNRRRIVVAALIVALMGLSVPASAELTAGQKMAAEALIRQFSHRDFAVREQAVNRLVALGPDVVPIVRKALAETTDNEVKLRCEMVLKTIAKDHGVDVGLAVKGPAKDWGLDASKVTLKMQDVDLDRIIEALSEQSGNTLVRLPEAWEGKPLTLDVTDMPYWQALDKLCASAKLIYTPDYQNGGLKLAAAEEGEDLSAYAGPTVLKLTSATQIRTFRGTAVPAAVQGMLNSLNYRFDFYWEDRLQPIQSEVAFTSAKAPDGTELKLNETPRTFVGVWGGGGGRRRTAASQAFTNITDVPANLEKVAELHGVVRLALGEGEKEIKVADALAEGEKSGKLDDTTLTVTSVNRRNNWATLGVKMTVDGKDTEITRYPAGSPYGFFLIDPNGEKHRGTSYGGFRQAIGGVLNRAGQPGNRNDGGGRPRRRGGRRREREAPNAADEKPGDDAAAPAAGAVVQVVLMEGAGDANVVVRREAGDANIVVAQAAGQRPGGRRAPGQNPGAGIMNVGGGQTNVSFAQLPEIQGVWTLVFVSPAKSTEKEFPFTFKDVPLP